MSAHPGPSSFSNETDDNRLQPAAAADAVVPVPSEPSISPSDLLTPRYEEPRRDPGRTPRYSYDDPRYSSVSHYAMDDEDETDDRPSYFDIPRRTDARSASDPQANPRTRSSPPSPSHSAAPSAISLQSLTISNGSRIGMDNFPTAVVNDIRRPRPSSRSGPGQTPPLPGPTIPHVYRPRKHTLPIATPRPELDTDTAQHPVPYRPYRNLDNQRRGSPNQSVADKSINSSGLNVNPGSPALSPGLFTPPSRRSDSRDFDEGDSQYRTPQLHPTHIGAPKETNYLQKNIDPLTGRRMFNNYEIIRTLGKGAHGTVKLAENKETNSPVAIKILRRSAKKRLGKEAPVMDQIKKEVAVLKQARHPHIVPLLEVIDDAEIDKVYLILEFMEKGEVKWRDETPKEIAEFELARVKREKAGTTLEEEQRIIAEFNADLAQRREFRLAKTAVQHAIATERLRTDNSNRERKERQKRQKKPKLLAEDALRHWSLEHGGESDEEEDSTEPSSGHVSVPLYSRASSAHRGSTSHREYSVPSEQASVIYPVNSEAASVIASAAGSRAASPTRLLLEKAIDQDEPKTGLQPFEVLLEKVIAEQTAWTAEEEEFRYVPRLNLAGIRSVFRDTLLGLEYLHYQGIIHRDIKPANLLYTAEYRVMISDFGVSYLGQPLGSVDKDHKLNADAFDAFEAVELARTVGTPAFYAPELCNRDNYLAHAEHSRPKITGSIDVWALGTTLYGMVFGRLPFHDENEFVMYDRIAKEELFIPSMRLKPVLNGEVTPNTRNQRAEDVLDYEIIDPSLRDLLTRMLAKDPKDRITVKALKRHEWVIRGMENPEAWIDENDPSKGGHAKKIEVSSKDLETAVAPVSFALAGFIKKGITRLGSVVRGRGSRKRADSSAASSDVETKSVRNRPASTDPGRKPSVPVDEAIHHALLASKQAHDHPLAHSEVSSPTVPRDPRDTFLPLTAPASPDFGGPLEPVRPANDMDHTLTSESIATVRNLRLHPPRRNSHEAPQAQVERDRSVRATLRGLFEGSRPSSRAKEHEPVPHEYQTQWRTTNMFDEPRSKDPVHASASLALSNATATVVMDNPLTRTITQSTASKDVPALQAQESLSPHATTSSDPESVLTSSTGTTLPDPQAVRGVHPEHATTTHPDHHTRFRPQPQQHHSSNVSRDPSPRRASSAQDSTSALSLNSMAMSLSQFTTPSTMLSSVISSPSLEDPLSHAATHQQRPTSLEAHLQGLDLRESESSSKDRLAPHESHHRGSSGTDKPLTEREKLELNTTAPVLVDQGAGKGAHEGVHEQYEEYDDDDEDEGLTF